MAETALSYPLGFGSAPAESDWPSAYAGTIAFSSPDLPSWLGKLRAEIAALRRYPQNWDSYGAPEINPRVLAAATSLLENLVYRGTPRPAVVPTSDGSVQIEWHARGMDVEVRWLSPFRIYVEVDDSRGVVNPIEEEFVTDMRALAHAIRALSSRTP